MRKQLPDKEGYASSLTQEYLKVIIIIEIYTISQKNTSKILSCNSPGEKFRVN